MRHWSTHDEAETRELGRRLARELLPAGTLLLYGDLGSGKTVLTQGLAAGLGIDARQVVSPTFTLVREHGGGKGRLLHVDLYRLAPEDVGGLGLEEMLMESAVKVVEWAERLPPGVEADLRLELRRGGGARCREIRELGPDEATPGAADREEEL